MTAKDFLAKFLGISQTASNVFGFSDPLFLLSQMYAENSGSSLLLDEDNNVGSLVSRPDASKPAKLPVNVYWSGDEIMSPASGLWFRKYDTLDNGFMDFAHCLAKYYQMNVPQTIQDYATKISNSRYLNIANGDNRVQYAANIISTYQLLKTQNT